MKPNQMKYILTVFFFIFGQIYADSIDCTALSTKANCDQNQSTCMWTSDITRNQCIQSFSCNKILSQQECELEANKNICSWTGYDQGCRKDPSVCQLNTSNNSCNTKSGCIEGTKLSCSPVLINTWGCEQRDFKDCQTKDTPFCIQSYSCVYNAQATCPKSVNPVDADQSCSGPCTLANFECKDICGTIILEGDCTNTKGCSWKEGSCINTKGSCPIAPKKVSDCTVNGCAVVDQDITCNAPTDYKSYCLKNPYCSDQTYCNKINGNTCVNDIYFCTQKTSCGPSQPYWQCLQSSSKTCENPNNDLSCSKLGQDECNTLCIWSNGKECSNNISDTACEKNFKTQDSCNLLKDGGCSFQPGGVCTLKGTDYNAFSLQVAFVLLSIYISFLF